MLSIIPTLLCIYGGVAMQSNRAKLKKEIFSIIDLLTTDQLKGMLLIAKGRNRARKILETKEIKGM